MKYMVDTTRFTRGKQKKQRINQKEGLRKKVVSYHRSPPIYQLLHNSLEKH